MRYDLTKHHAVYVTLCGYLSNTLPILTTVLKILLFFFNRP